MLLLCVAWISNEFPYDVLATPDIHCPWRVNVHIWDCCKCSYEHEEPNIKHISWKLYVAVICVPSSASNLCFKIFLFFASPSKGWCVLWLDIAAFVRYEFVVVVTKGTSFMVCDECYLVNERHCVGGNSAPVKVAAHFSDALMHIYQATRCHIIQLGYFLLIVNILKSYKPKL